jgi:hypothetical protein
MSVIMGLALLLNAVQRQAITFRGPINRPEKEYRICKVDIQLF